MKKLNFIPKIDDCSREIANIKREVSRGKTASIYDDLYQKVFRKDKSEGKIKKWDFHPKICPKSDQLVKKSR